MKQVSQLKVKPEWLWGQQDRDANIIFHIYQTGQQNNACQWCFVTVLKELFYHPSMCIQNPIANLQLMIFCKVQQEAKLFITHQKDWWIQMLSLHSYTIFITKKNDRPVVLLINSVSSHINKDIFTKAGSGGIEIYILVPNATHLMQL